MSNRFTSTVHLSHVAMTDLGIPQPNHHPRPNTPPIPKTDIFCCHGYHASKVTARWKSSV